MTTPTPAPPRPHLALPRSMPHHAGAPEVSTWSTRGAASMNDVDTDRCWQTLAIEQGRATRPWAIEEAPSPPERRRTMNTTRPDHVHNPPPAYPFNRSSAGRRFAKVSRRVVWYEWISRVRCRLRAETPSLLVASSQQALNHTVSGVRVRSNTVPAVTEVRPPHLEHINRPSPRRQRKSRIDRRSPHPRTPTRGTEPETTPSERRARGPGISRRSKGLGAGRLVRCADDFVVRVNVAQA